MFCDPVSAYSAASLGPESFKSSVIHVFDNIVLVLGVIKLLNSNVKDFDTKKSARFMVCSPYLTPRAIKMDSVFSLTLARSPMASRSYRQASDFLNYSPGLASDILVELKSEKNEKKFFFKISSPHSHDTVAFQKTDLIMIIYNV